VDPTDKTVKYVGRIEALRRSMGEHGMDAIFLAPSGDMEYITGLRRRPPDPTEAVFTGDDLLGILITTDRITTFLPPSAAIHGIEGQLMKCPWLCEDIVRLPRGEDQPEEGYAVFGKMGLAEGTLALPRRAQAMTVINLSHHYPHMKFVNAETVTSPLRSMRDPDDIELIRQACRITDEVFWEVLSKLRPGDVEADIIREVDFQMIKHGAESPSFNTMLLTGRPGTGRQDFPVPAGSSPGTAGGVLTPGMVLAFDFGVVYEGMCSDFGRTVYFGEPTAAMREAHLLVAESQRLAMEMMVADKVTGGEADAVSRKVFEDVGRGEEYIHGLGHGVGVDIHEAPSLSQGSEDLLREGMTVAVEPSLWVNREYFVRVEDICVVTPTGAQTLHDISTYDLFVVE
jgi:Xaa-Pro aminopeptidase